MNRMCLLVLIGLGLAHVACGRKAPERQERSRDFAWDLVPGECRDLPRGDFLVNPVIKP